MQAQSEPVPEKENRHEVPFIERGKAHEQHATDSSPLPPPNLRLEEYDLVILGGGTGSIIAAWTFAGKGQQVAVVDRKFIGGSCPNIACFPSKNIIHTAKVVSYVRRSSEYGIARDAFTVKMAAVRDRKRRMVSAVNQVFVDNYKRTGADPFAGD